LEYSIESEDIDTKRAKSAWISAKNEYQVAVESGALQADLEKLERKISSTYNSYIHYLEYALKKS
jgi:non-canonical (house-cleaning) NTP pyrophosphatase